MNEPHTVVNAIYLSYEAALAFAHVLSEAKGEDENEQYEIDLLREKTDYILSTFRGKN